jgi:enterochelin esterase family protein
VAQKYWAREASMNGEDRVNGIRPQAEVIDAICALVEAARQGSPNLRERLEVALDDASGVASNPLPPGSGRVAVSGQDFLFLFRTDQPAEVSIDDRPPVPMTPIEGTGVSHRLETLRLGTTHNYNWHIGGQIVGDMGGTMPFSVAGYNPGSYPIPGAQRGTLSAMRTVTSKIYDGAECNYWVYTNPGIDTERGAPLMIWLDGQSHVGLAGVFGVRMQTVTDNLVHRKLIPPMVHLLIAPGTGGSTVLPIIPDGSTRDAALRSFQYDTLSDDFRQHLVDEVLPEVERSVKLRRDGYSRAITGQSSGAVAAFKVCWDCPEEFSRVYSTIGSFSAMQWLPEQHLDGGNIFPFRIRREPRRNIRIWLSDGMHDVDPDSIQEPRRGRETGSWPLGNLQMAQALKARLYDFHLRYGTAAHNAAQSALELPESLAWLWRGYDPARTSEVYEQEEAERAQPMYRVQVVNRDSW